MKGIFKFIAFFLLSFFFSLQAKAHAVDYYTTCGYVCTGSTITVDAAIVAAGSGTFYNWQYRDNSGTWKCFVNGSNTINGKVFTVSGASAKGPANDAPLLSIQNASAELENLEVRILMADNGTPCGSPTYSVWGGDKDPDNIYKSLRLHVLSGADCSTISTYCGMGGCNGNILSDANGYYGGFEASNNFASAGTNYSVGSGCTMYNIVNNPQQSWSWASPFAPRSGSNMMIVDGSSTSSNRVWFKNNVSVVNGSTYQFSVWATTLYNTTTNLANIIIKVGGITVGSGTVSSVAGFWTNISGSFVATTTGNVTIEVFDGNLSCSDNDFAIDDICFKFLSASPVTTNVCGTGTFNPFNVIEDFNVFSQNNVEFNNGHVDGAVALGGDLVLNGASTVAMANAGTYPNGSSSNANLGLVVGGKIIYTSGGYSYLNSGNLSLGNTTGTKLWELDPNNATVNLRATSNALTGWNGYNSLPALQVQKLQTAASATTTSGLNFTTAFNTLASYSNTIAGYSATSACSSQLNIISISGTSPTVTLVPNKINVINITGTTFAGFTQITFTNKPTANTPLIFNINHTGSLTDNFFQSIGLTNTDAGYILYNFYNATGNIQIEGGNTMYGSVLIPNGQFTWNNSNNLEGQVASKSFLLCAGEIHSNPFNACLPNCAAPSCDKSLETLPNQFNTGFSSPLNNATFTGSTGSWNVNSSSNATIVVTTPPYSPSTSFAIKVVQGANTTATSTLTTSPVVNLSSICCPAQLTLQYTLWTHTVNSLDNTSVLAWDFSNDNGVTWNQIASNTPAQLNSLYGAASKVTLSLPIPLMYQNANFKYRIRSSKLPNNPYDFYVYIDDIKIASPVSCSSTLSLGNYVWLDANNNGIQDGSESGIAGVTVKLYYDLNNDNIPDGASIASTTTNSNGGYTFNNLSAYRYIVSVVLPSGYINSATTATSTDPNNSTINDNNGVVIFNTNEIRSNSINLTATNDNVDFGLITASLSLTASTGICAATNSNTYTLTGLASFTNAPSTGSLVISVQGGSSVVFNAPFVSPIAYSITGQIADGASRVVSAIFTATTISGSTSFTAPSAIGTGFFNFPLNSSITNLYWGNSPYPQQGWDNAYVPGLGGPNGLGGGVHDLDLSPSGVTDMAAFCAEMAEAADATTNLANKYKVIPLENINRGRAGELTTESANIPVGGIGSVRAGMLRYLYDNYYTSTNANNWTNQNGAAFQLAVWEILHESYSSNNSFSVTASSSNGFYVLATYNTASITQAQTYLNAINALNWNNNQWMSYQSVNWHVIALEANNNTNPGTPDGQDFLIAQPIIGGCNLNLGNNVWVDLNNDGIYNNSEPVYTGATVKLYADANADNVPDGAALATTTTDAFGRYNFNNLRVANYIVGVMLPTNFTASTTTATSSNPNNDIDNDNNGVTTTSGELRSNYISLSVGAEPANGVDGDGINGNLTLDFGIKPTQYIGNYVWYDINRNGVQDAPSTGEFGAAGIKVELYNSSNALLQTTYTDRNGFYYFAVATGSYYVKFSGIPAGLKFTSQGGGTTSTDSDSNPSTGITATFTISSGVNNITIDAGLVTTAGVGNFVWSDTNGNGQQDGGESGIPGIYVGLYNSSTNALVGAAITDATGYYFINTVPGNYYLKINVPSGYNLTTQAAGGVPANLNSDANVSTYKTNNFSLAAVVDNDWDFGLVLKPNTIVSCGQIPLQVTEISSNITLNKFVPTGYGSLTNVAIDYNALTINPFVGVENTANGAQTFTLNTTSTATLSLPNTTNLVVNNGFSTGTVSLATNDGVLDYQGTSGWNLINNTNGNSVVSSPYTPSSDFLWTTGATTLALPFSTLNSSSLNMTGGNNSFQITTMSAAGACVSYTYEALNLGNLVWIDLNGDGVKQTTEATVAAGNTVYLYQDVNGDNLPDGAAIATTTTNGSGLYNFTNLAAGNYIVGVQLPTGFTGSRVIATSSNPNNDINNDNNGVRNSGGILYSNFITLSINAEPATGVDGDGTNGNLTLDFGIAKDTDGDKIPDVIDIDDDNDGITDLNESGGYDPLGDCDNDGTPNYLDTTPGCTTPTGNDPWGVPYKPLVFADCNMDLVNDFFDWDRDGIINELDLDSDNDGILDVQEARPNGVAVTATANGMITGTDADGNGLLSSYENGNINPVLNGIAAQDFDRDGTPNFLDLDSDGDGITDLTEALGVYSTTGVVSGTDTDGDGVRAEVFGSSAATTADNINGFGAKGITLLDSDNDGRPNTYDIDSDNDGITDNAESQATCSNKLPSGNDCDGDGVDDSYDAGGCSSCLRTSGGVTPFDKDADGTPDYLDLDTDNDGALDIYEGHSIPSTNGNVPPLNYWIAQIGDTDKDGLLDYFDGLNIVTATGGNYWRNVINNNMGNNGTFDTGAGSTGSITQLPKSQVSTDCTVGDRDWRNITILPASFVEFKGNLNNNIVNVTWTVTKETNLSHYEVERSSNGSVFTKVANVQAANAGLALVTYNATDDISTLAATTVYYRIKIVEKDGSFKHSNIISFKLNNKKAGIVVNPNPATTYFTLKITTTKDAVAQVKVIDMMGKTLITQNNKVMTGLNTYTFNNLSNFSAGTYSVQVLIDNQLFTEKLIVVK